MKKRACLIILVFIFSIFISICYANNTVIWTEDRDDFDSIAWKKGTWIFHPDNAIPQNLKPYISLLKNYNEKTGGTRYWVSLNFLNDGYCFFPVGATKYYGNHQVKIDGDLYSFPIVKSNVKNIHGDMYLNFTQGYLSSEIISKIKESNDVTFRFIYDDQYHPSDRENETIKIPDDVLQEWKKMIN